jgi:hypothetical protein
VHKYLAQQTLFDPLPCSEEKKETESKSSTKPVIEAVDISPPRETQRAYKARHEDSTVKKDDVKSKSSDSKVRYITSI